MRPAPSRKLSTASSCVPALSSKEYLLELGVVAGELLVALAKLCRLAAGVQDRRVVAPAERLADLRQALLRELLGKRHRDLAQAGHGTETLLRIHLRDLDLEIVGHGLLDVLDGDLAVQHREQVLQRLERSADGDRRMIEAGVGEHALQRP